MVVAEPSTRSDSLIISAPLPPTTNHLYATGKDGRRYLTAKARRYKNEVRWQMLAEGSRAKCPEPPFVLSLHLRLPDRRRADVTNRVKLIEDAIFAQLEYDDSLVLDAHLFKYIDRQNPGVTVEIRHTDRRLEAAG